MLFITEAQINHVQKVLRYQFIHQAYLLAAVWNQQSSPISKTESVIHSRDSLAAIGESTIRTAFLLEGYSASSPGRLAQQLQNSELAGIGYVHALHQSLDLTNCYDGGEAIVATIVKAILGAVFLDSRHSMLEVRAVMQNLGFSFPPARDPSHHPRPLALQQLESNFRSSRQATPDCFNGPDCGCGCLWLDQYSSAGWYTPTKDSGKFSASQLERISRSHSMKNRQFQQQNSTITSMDRLKNWIVEVEPDADGKNLGEWFTATTSDDKEAILNQETMIYDALSTPELGSGKSL